MSAITGVTSTLVQGVNSVQAEIATVQNELATGVKTMNPAQKGIVTRLSSQVAIYSSDAANITQASSVINVGQTSLNNLSTIISQMQQLATQAASGGLSTTDLASLNTTFTALASQISAAIQNATVNGNNFLYNSPTGTYGSTTNGTITIQIGLDTTGTATIVGQGLDTTLAMLVTGLSISSQTGANSAITALASGLTSVSTAQSNLNAFSTAMASDLASVTSLGANLTTTINSLQAVDQTAAQAELQQLNNQQSVDYYLVSQMNTEAAAILTLFR
jgi:flagellin-like hook-associated protein FlgL